MEGLLLIPRLESENDDITPNLEINEKSIAKRKIIILERVPVIRKSKKVILKKASSPSTAKTAHKRARSRSTGQRIKKANSRSRTRIQSRAKSKKRKTKSRSRSKSKNRR